MRVRSRLACVALGILSACAVRRETPPVRPLSVLLVTLDTTRADAFGCISGQGVTPRMDALAARGTVFADCTAPAPLTLPSHATMMTGQDPLTHGLRSNGLYSLSPESETLAELMRASGRRTAAFVSSAVLARRYGLDQGFEAYSEPRGPGARAGEFAERDAETIRAESEAWLRALPADATFFAWAHFFDPHAPYQAPPLWTGAAGGDPYRGEIARVDAAVGALVDALQSLGRLDDTLVVVVADHGEDRGDHGEVTHGLLLYQSTLHVPLIVAGPGVRVARIDAPVGVVDLAPTVREAVGLASSAPQDGTSLWSALTRGAPAADRGLYAETLEPREQYGWSELHAWRRGRLKYVLAPRPELYDVRADPGERADLAGVRASDAARMRSELEAWMSRERAPAQASSVTPTETEREMLESLGYVGAAGIPAGAAALRDPKDGVADLQRINAAGALVSAGRLDDAIRELRAAIDASPEQTQGRFMLLTALLMKGRPDDAAKEARAIIEVSKSAPSGKLVAARAEIALAEIAERQGRAADAIAHWERAFAVPQPDAARLHVAGLLAKAGRTQDARAWLAPLLAQPQPPPGARELATSLGR